LNWLVKSVV